MVRGIEIVFKGSASASLSWWASYVISRAEDLIDGVWVRRSWDQRHALTAGLNLSLPSNWSFSFSGQYHSGWPTTELTAEAVAAGEDEPEIVTTVGPRNASSYPAYGRLDLRISKLFPTDRGEFRVYLEILNLTNRTNVCCTEDFEFEIEDDLSVTVIPEYRSWAPFIPTFGLGWRF